MKALAQMELPDPGYLYTYARRMALWHLTRAQAAGTLSPQAYPHGLAAFQPTPKAAQVDDHSAALKWWSQARGLWELHSATIASLHHTDGDPDCCCPACTESACPGLQATEDGHAPESS